MGLTLVALKAGISPMTVPSATKIINAKNTTDMGTEALTKVASKP